MLNLVGAYSQAMGVKRIYGQVNLMLLILFIDFIFYATKGSKII
jgi:hypothetical protein